MIYKRGRKKLTDYRKRLRLVKGKIPRLVIRKSNKQILLQLILASEGGDRTLLTVRSSELSRFGYEGDKKNLSAAYLTGLLFGKRVKGREELILDTGMHSPTKRSRIFAAVKGVRDCGIDVRCDESMLPQDIRIPEEIKKRIENE